MTTRTHNPAPLFQSFFLGGFECSTHRLENGKRLDMIAATGHDRFQLEDYARLRSLGIRTAREGVRWHLVETRPGVYDFSSVLPMVRNARRMGMQVIWDLLHYGYPDDLDPFQPAFVDRFARYASAFTALLRDECDAVPFIAPVNEPSFFAWGGGDTGYLNPFARNRGYELKAQLVRCVVAATEAVWDKAPNARVVQIDPIIHIAADPRRPWDVPEVNAYNEVQYQAWDMIAGRVSPELGGQERYLDVIGVNYYDRNQWIHNSATLSPVHALYRPVWQMLREVWLRYRRPMFIAETGTENARRPAWLAHVGAEVSLSIRAGVPVEGICLYPILNHPGWDNDRHCHNGLWDYCDENGHRVLFRPLAEEIAAQLALPVFSAQWEPPPSLRRAAVSRMASVADLLDLASIATGSRSNAPADRWEPFDDS